MILTNRHFPLKTFVAATLLTAGGLILTILASIKLADLKINESDTALYSILTSVGIISFVSGIITALYARKRTKKGQQIYAVEMVGHKAQLKKTVILSQRMFRKTHNPESLYLRYQRRNKNNPFKSKRLFIREATLDDLKPLNTQLKKWENASDKRIDEYRKASLKSKLDHETMQKELNNFIGSSESCDTIQSVVNSMLNTQSFKRRHIYYAVDENNTLQAITIAKPSTGAQWEIEYLATAPHNIKTKLLPMNNALRVEDAPKALIEHVAFQSYKTKRNPKWRLDDKMTTVFLYYKNSSFDYYKDIGFELNDTMYRLRGEHLRRFRLEFGGRAFPVSA